MGLPRGGGGVEGNPMEYQAGLLPTEVGRTPRPSEGVATFSCFLNQRDESSQKIIVPN